MTSTTFGPKLVIFDCDGVLVDSEPLSIRVLVETMHELGIDLTADDCYRHFLGRSFTSLKLTLKEKFDRTLSDEQITGIRERLHELFRRELLPVPGVAEMLAGLGVPVCVASSSLPDRIRFSLEVTGLAGFFGDRVFSASMVVHGKPAPDLFLLAARRMGVAPENCVVIEDSPAGIEAAHQAAMRAFAFIGGSHAVAANLRECVAPLQPYRIFKRMEELPDLLAQL